MSNEKMNNQNNSQNQKNSQYQNNSQNQNNSNNRVDPAKTVSSNSKSDILPAGTPKQKSPYGDHLDPTVPNRARTEMNRDSSNKKSN